MIVPGNRYAGDWSVLNAYRLVVAAKADRRDISIDEEILMITQKGRQLDSETNSQLAAERASNAAAAMAAFSIMNANQPLNVNAYHHY